MGNEIASSNKNRALAIKEYLRSPEVIQRFQEVLGRNPMPYISSVMLAVASDENLQLCDPRSITTSAMRAALMQLPVGSEFGYAYIVPFKSRAKLIIGYKGLVQLALRTNKYRIIHTMAVYEGQNVVEDQDGWHLVKGFGTSKKTIGYLSFFKMVNQFQKSLYMTVDEIIEHAKKYSKSFNNPESAWKTNFDDMAKKTVLRLLLQRWGYLDPYALMALDEGDENEEEENLFDLPDKGEITIVPPEQSPDYLAPPENAEQALAELGYDEKKKVSKKENKQEKDNAPIFNIPKELIE